MGRISRLRRLCALFASRKNARYSLSFGVAGETRDVVVVEVVETEVEEGEYFNVGDSLIWREGISSRMRVGRGFCFWLPQLVQE